METLPLPNWGNVVACIVIALSVASASFTIARMKVSEPIRKYAKLIHPWLGDLFSCPFCLAYWFIFFALFIYRIRIIELFWPTDMLITSFVVVWISYAAIGVLSKAVKV